jgi:hypothetical protein
MANLTPEQEARLAVIELAARRANPRGLTTAEMEREARATRVPSGPVREAPSAEYMDPAEQAKLDAMTKAYNRDEYTSKVEKRKTGGAIKKMAKGGMTASKRADGIAQRGKTRGTMVMCGGGMTKGKR